MSAVATRGEKSSDEFKNAPAGTARYFKIKVNRNSALPKQRANLIVNSGYGTALPSWSKLL